MTQSSIDSDKVNDDWVLCKWPYNSAISFDCYRKSMPYGRDIILHYAFKCIDTDTVDGMGSWEEDKSAFEFTVIKCFSGRCPDTIKDLESAKNYAIKSALRW
jgi:hypothetical protein